jgi:hypothetical protein
MGRDPLNCPLYRGARLRVALPGLAAMVLAGALAGTLLFVPSWLLIWSAVQPTVQPAMPRPASWSSA